MKPKIIFTSNSQYSDYKMGEKGVVDGYISGGDGVPCAVVVKDNGCFVLACINHIMIYKEENEE